MSWVVFARETSDCIENLLRLSPPLGSRRSSLLRLSVGPYDSLNIVTGALGLGLNVQVDVGVQSDAEYGGAVVGY